MIVSNSSELIECYAQLLNGKIKAEEVIIAENFVAGMRFRGDKWKGRVDTSIAVLVIDLQKNIRRAYKKAAIIDGFKAKSREKDICVELVVGNGSSNIVSILEKLLPIPLLSMSSEHALYCSIVIALTILGVKHIDTKSELLKKIEDESTKRKLVEMNQAMLTDIQASLRPFVRLAKRMDKDNVLEFSETGAILTREEAIEHFSVQHVPEVITFNIDDTYDVTNVHLKSTKVTLEIREIRFIALIEDLSDKDKKTLFAEIDDAGVASGWPSLDMQITLSIHGSDKIARVLNLGPKRPDAVTIEHALFVSGIADERKSQRHLPLLDFAGE